MVGAAWVLAAGSTKHKSLKRVENIDENAAGCYQQCRKSYSLGGLGAEGEKTGMLKAMGRTELVLYSVDGAWELRVLGIVGMKNGKL